MQLFVVRHAVAVAAAPDRDDATRPLSSAGKRKFHRAVRGMRTLGWRFDRVLSSPWERAAQTAKLLGAISIRAPYATELLCIPPRKELLELISDSDSQSVAVVGHEPWLGELVGWLAFGDARHGEAVELKKGCVVWLEGTVIPGGMTLRAVMPPKL